MSHPVMGMVFKTIERSKRPLIGSTPICSRQRFIGCQAIYFIWNFRIAFPR